MRFCSRLLTVTLAVPALACPINATANTPPFIYRSSGTCLVSSGGFNSKLEPINSGVSWTMTFTSVGSVDDHGASTEVGQAVDTASFGVGPRMHFPAAYAYDDTFTVAITVPGDGSSATSMPEQQAEPLPQGPMRDRASAFQASSLRRPSATMASTSTAVPRCLSHKPYRSPMG